MSSDFPFHSELKAKVFTVAYKSLNNSRVCYSSSHFRCCCSHMDLQTLPQTHQTGWALACCSQTVASPHKSWLFPSLLLSSPSLCPPNIIKQTSSGSFLHILIQPDIIHTVLFFSVYCLLQPLKQWEIILLATVLYPWTRTVPGTLEPFITSRGCRERQRDLLRTSWLLSQCMESCFCFTFSV